MATVTLVDFGEGQAGLSHTYADDSLLIEVVTVFNAGPGRLVVNLTDNATEDTVWSADVVADGETPGEGQVASGDYDVTGLDLHMSEFVFHGQTVIASPYGVNAQWPV